MNFIGYVRVSTVKQSRQFSLAAQKEAIQKYCKLKKHKLIAIHEESRSAVKNRPVFVETFQRVLNDKKIDGIIIAKLDRMGRSVKDLANIGGQLHEAKKQLVSVHDSLDTSTANGRLLFNMLSAIAEYERELLLERTKEGRKRAQKEGKLMHRPQIPIDKDELKSLYQQEVPIAQLARVFGVHKDTIRRRLDGMGLRSSASNQEVS